MAIIDLFLARRVKRGRLTIVHHDGQRRSFGTADPAMPDVTARFTDKGAARAIIRDPGLGAGEAYMNGRLVIDEGDVLDLVALLTANDLWEKGAKALQASPTTRAIEAITHRIGRINRARAAKRNVAHHYDLSDRLYDLFLDADRQYSC
ncbi:MAG: class I SAM-dependent methyltransferase, partial [Sphingomonas sp.]|nr:class I SAM-dependent methyltransferase [Sphingomonas sp.]